MLISRSAQMCGTLLRMCYDVRAQTQRRNKTMQQPSKTTSGTSRRKRLMNKKRKTETSDGYLKILEEAKKQYQPYVELGKLCDLLESMEEEEQVEYVPPSFDNPLTTNKFRVADH